MDKDFELPDDLQDVEIIYSDGEYDDDEDENIEDMVDQIQLSEEPEAPIIDLAKLVFTKHGKSVFSSDLTKDSKWAVTGSEDDMAYVWDTSTGEVVFECTGHKDSVTEVAFNYNGQYLATGDMSGLVQVWNWSEKSLLWCFEGDDLNWLQWHSEANVLICGFHSGDIYVWQIPQGHTKVLPSSNTSPSTCGKLLPNGKQLLAGYEDGTLKLWDIKSSSIVWQNDQNTSITALDINLEGNLAIVAPSAQLIKLLDGKLLSKLLVDDESEIEQALFNSQLNIVATGALSGHLSVWELAKQSIRHEARIECAVTVLKWGLNGQIFIGGADGALYVCDAKSGTLSETLTGHKTEILSVSVFSDGRKVLTTSDDGSARVFDVKP